MWLKLPNNSNLLYISNGLHNLKDFDLEEETFFKKIGFLSWKNRKGIIFLRGEGKENLLTKIQYKEVSCPIFISSSNFWIDDKAKQKLSSALVKEKGKNMLQMFFNRKTFKKPSNIFLSIFSGLILIFSYAYGAFSSLSVYFQIHY